MKSAFDSMLVSNKLASQIFVNHNASACTDITGFGLAGHLLEMMEASAAEVDLELDSLPLLSGTLDSLKAGFLSSLHEENASVAPSISFAKGQAASPLSQTLFDPQTSGGLLASIPIERVESCLDALKQSGLMYSRIIGVVTAIAADEPKIRII
jgi:selenide,water dikinase